MRGLVVHGDSRISRLVLKVSTGKQRIKTEKIFGNHDNHETG